MEKFAKQFRERLEGCMKHGQREAVAAAARVTRDEVSRWGRWKGKHWQIPTLYEVLQSAGALGVSSAYLAFGLGPKDPEAAERGRRIGAFIETDQGLERLVEAYRRAAPPEREHLLWLADRLSPDAAQRLKGAASVPRVADTKAEGRSLLERAAESFPAYGDRPGFINTRDELPQYAAAGKGASRRGPRAVRAPQIELPQWLNLAAGPGRMLERCEEDLHLEATHGARHWHVARVKGESMLETLHDGDRVILESAGAEGLRLQPLSAGDAKNPINRLRLQVPHDSLWVLSVNDPSELTVKRVRYSRENDPDWHLLILADNPHEPGYPRVVGRSDEVIFWARVVGIVKPAETHSKRSATE